MSQQFNKGGYLGGRDLLLVIITILLIFQNPPVPPVEAASVEAPGNMIVTAIWPDGPADVDLWMLSPGETVPVGYSNRAGKVSNLLRDDLGTNGDSMPLNFENIYTRGLPAGQYVANLHCYSCRRGNETVKVEIRFGLPGQAPRLLAEETVVLAPGQERTVIAFRLDDKGNVVPGSVNRVFKPLRSATK
jgi:hypothetical protein